MKETESLLIAAQNANYMKAEIDNRRESIGYVLTGIKWFIS